MIANRTTLDRHENTVQLLGSRVCNKYQNAKESTRKGKEEGSREEISSIAVQVHVHFSHDHIELP